MSRCEERVTTTQEMASEEDQVVGKPSSSSGHGFNSDSSDVSSSPPTIDSNADMSSLEGRRSTTVSKRGVKQDCYSDSSPSNDSSHVSTSLDDGDNSDSSHQKDMNLCEYQRPVVLDQNLVTLTCFTNSKQEESESLVFHGRSRLVRLHGSVFKVFSIDCSSSHFVISTRE